MHEILEQVDDDVLLRVKVVPGARQEKMAGVLGDRLKIRTNAPPEGGRANVAICALVARVVGCSARDVTVESGRTNPEKTLRLHQIDIERVRNALELAG